MGTKPKAGGPKKKKAKPKKTDEKQFERFIETARKMGASDGKKSFEKAFDAIVKPARKA